MHSGDLYSGFASRFLASIQQWAESHQREKWYTLVIAFCNYSKDDSHEQKVNMSSRVDTHGVMDSSRMSASLEAALPAALGGQSRTRLRSSRASCLCFLGSSCSSSRAYNTFAVQSIVPTGTCAGKPNTFRDKNETKSEPRSVNHIHQQQLLFERLAGCPHDGLK